MARDSTATSRTDETRGGSRGLLQPVDPLDLERELLQRRGDQARQHVDDQQLDEDCREPQHQHAAIVLAELPGEVLERRHDEQLPSLAEALVEVGEAGDVVAPVVAECIDRRGVAPGPETVGKSRQPRARPQLM